MKVHKSITYSRVMEAAQRQQVTLDDPGFCLACGEDAYECEEDAREHECEHCGSYKVYGASEIFMMGMYHKDGKD